QMVRRRRPARGAIVDNKKLAAQIQRQVEQRSEIAFYRLRDVAARSDHQMPRQNRKRVVERDEIFAERHPALFRRQILRAQKTWASFDRRRVNLRRRADDPLRVELRQTFGGSDRKLLVFPPRQPATASRSMGHVANCWRASPSTRPRKSGSDSFDRYGRSASTPMI